MKRTFTKFFAAFVCLALMGVANVFAETVLLYHTGTKKQILNNTEIGADVPEGFSLTTPDTKKTIDPANEITVNGKAYTSFKWSNGSQNTLSLPDGVVATKITFYTYDNRSADPDKGTFVDNQSYWKEVNGVTYEGENIQYIHTPSDKPVTSPTVCSFDLDNATGQITFKNAGKQLCCVIELEYTTSSSLEPAAAPTIEKEDEDDTVFPMNVVLTNNEAGATVYYTIDGSTPNETSASFTGASKTITVEEACTVKAVVIAEGKSEASASLVLTGTYATDSDTPVITFEEGETSTVTITAEEGATIYYTTNGSEPTTSSTKYSAPFTVAEPTTVKAIAVATKKNPSAVATSAVTVLPTTGDVAGNVLTAGEEYNLKALAVTNKDAVLNCVTIKGAYIAGTGNDSKTIGDIKDSGFKMRRNGNGVDGNELVLYVNSGCTVTALEAAWSINGNGEGFDVAGIYVDGNNDDNLAEGKNWTVSGTAATQSTLSLSGIEAKSQIRIAFSAGTGAATQYNALFKFTYEVGAPASVTITEALYSTFYSESAHQIADGLTVYTATLNGDCVALNEITGFIPAKTPVILKGAAQTYSLPFATSSAKIIGNDLKGTATEIARNADVTTYILANGSEGVAFYPYEGDKITAGKAYLEVAKAAAAPVVRINATVTGISNIAAEAKSQVIFNLNGQRVNDLTQPGLYIVNGKKMLVK